MQLNPTSTEYTPPAHKHPFYIPSFTSRISPTKEIALELAQKAHHKLKFKAYSDGSVLDSGVGAAAILYKNDKVLKVRRVYLGTAAEHMIFKAKLVGILLVLSLLTALSCQLLSSTLIGLNSQATIKALNEQSYKLSQYLLDHIHDAAKKLQVKQDKLQNAVEHHMAR